MMDERTTEQCLRVPEKISPILRKCQNRNLMFVGEGGTTKPIKLTL